jgi:hypothetical protein
MRVEGATTHILAKQSLKGRTFQTTRGGRLLTYDISSDTLQSWCRSRTCSTRRSSLSRSRPGSIPTSSKRHVQSLQHHHQPRRHPRVDPRYAGHHGQP